MTLDELARNHMAYDKERIDALLRGDSITAYQQLMEMYLSVVRTVAFGFSLSELFVEIERIEEEAK